MELEAESPQTFIGFHTVWAEEGLRVWPLAGDPWTGAVYHDSDTRNVCPWASWGPPHQRIALLITLLCRVAYASSSRTARCEGLWEALTLLRYQAGFPWSFVRRETLKWAKRWVPKRPCRDRGCLSQDVDRALARNELYSIN